MKKASSHDYKGRIKEIISDPNNIFIPRVYNAGTIVKDNLVLHNGIKTVLGIYGELFQVFIDNRGVHEPQEERVFQEVLPNIRCGGTMLELGSYWAFYSMWFMKAVKESRCFLIEPDTNNMQVGKKNFDLNHMKGNFFLGKIGLNDITLDIFIKENNIDSIDILHSDIQGAEHDMLLGAKQSIKERKIKYVFISTHSQKLHYQCRHFLKKHGYIIIASADMAQTYCHDGVLVARLSSEKGVSPVPIALASFSTGSIWRDIAYKLLRFFYPILLPVLQLQARLLKK